MLKITQDAETADIIKVCLCGLFTAEYVPEVERALARDNNQTAKMALDLKDVTLVDRAAMEFLRAAKSRNIGIKNLPSYVRRWIKQDAINRSHLRAGTN